MSIQFAVLDHHIQKHIIAVLLRQKYARFRDLRPPGVDSNLYSYHLKLLLRRGMVIKVPEGYTLGIHGLQYVDRVSEQKLNLRTQPKIITMLYAENPDGRILLQRRAKQPHIDTWSLPHGKIHIEDTSIVAAAAREAYEKLGTIDDGVWYMGSCYVRLADHGAVFSSTLIHVCRLSVYGMDASDDVQWVEYPNLAMCDLAPAVEHIVTLCQSGASRFFEEIICEESRA